ncbi:hypothetical protein N752_07400 [Desulforamulus aquiferis]|nr:hypothetical protein N752_07400 [Desulforamulus aquiferis]
MQFDIESLKYNQAGLIPAIVQEYQTGQVLMMAWMNREAVEKTMTSGETWFFSRSRNKMWKKGETSGHIQRVKSLYYDCDGDTLLIQVEQVGGAACHEGYVSCFHYKVKTDGSVVTEGEQKFEPAEVYGMRSEANEAAGPEIISHLYEVIMSRRQSDQRLLYHLPI